MSDYSYLGRGKTTRALEAYARETPAEQLAVARAKSRLATMKSRMPYTVGGPLSGLDAGRVDTPFTVLAAPTALGFMFDPVTTGAVVGSLLGVAAAVKGIQHIRNKSKRNAIKEQAIREIDAIRAQLSGETVVNPMIHPRVSMADVIPGVDGRGMKPKRKPSAHALRVREIMKQNPGMKLGEASKLASSQRS